MRKQGKVVRWKDDKGFGFIEPSGGGKQAFVHIKAFHGGTRRPANGDEVSYLESRDSQGRIKAERVQFLTAKFALGSASKALMAALFFLVAVAGGVALGIYSSLVLWLYLGMSALTFCFYFIDKEAAQNGRQRTPESRLHLLALAGGWPGALYAQQLLRHKSSKESFRAVYRVTVGLNLAGLGYLASDYGRWLVEIFRQLMR
jgi:uncharacterized membrane protein YsdA (DUF1294 family)/cold shock CspA family protein